LLPRVVLLRLPDVRIMPSGVFCFAAAPVLAGRTRATSLSPAGGRGSAWSSSAAVAVPANSSSSFVAHRSL